MVQIYRYCNADDALFFGKWSLKNARNLIQIIKLFGNASGLKINMSKSRLYGVGVDPLEVENVVRRIKCSHDFLPFTYLGLRVRNKMKSVEAWSGVLDKFTSRLSSWKTQNISVGGRLTLLKSVLGSLPLYLFSLFHVPVKILNDLEALRRRFFWGFQEGEKKINWIKWDTILLPKSKGGLGVGSLKAKNYGLLGKWVWSFYSDLMHYGGRQ